MPELLDLLLRWIHVIAGIMWIGNSLLFNWLDRNLLPPRAATREADGQIWLVHSGGFYDVLKTRTFDATRLLHWFKWQAYTTWLSGAALLVIVYYLGPGALLIGMRSGPELFIAAALGLTLIIAPWFLYHFVLSPLLHRYPIPAAAVSLALVLGAELVLRDRFGGRAAFLYVGAILGTLMAGNVFRVIIPSQRELVRAVEAGRAPDARLAARAKTRSIHNNYLTFPVIALMLSPHFPSLYGHPRSWLVLAILLVAGALTRHALNIRFTTRRWLPLFATTAAAALAALYLLAGRPRVESRTILTAGAPVTFDQAHAVIAKRCTICHSTSPADRSFGIAPGGVSFDSPEQIQQRAERIRMRAVDTETMPPGNKTWMTQEEREVLRRWLEAGAPVE